MSNHGLTEQQMQEALDALAKHRSKTGAARALGLPETTFRNRLNRARVWAAKGTAVPEPQPESDPVAERQEVYNSGFWRRRAKALAKDLAKAEQLLEEVAGIRNVPVVFPHWLRPQGSGRKGRAVLNMLLTDIHMGECVDSAEILGLNEFNPEIAERRVKRFFDAAFEIGPRWAADSQIEGLVLYLGGDLISGDIHEELRITNALTAHEQVRSVVAIVTAGIKEALKTYPRVHVVSVPGNHARTTFKPTAKLYARLSYDTLIAQMVQDRLMAEERLTFQITASNDALVPIFGRTVFCTHGDKIGTGGGQGFIGPIAPIVRGAKKIQTQQASVGRRPDLIVHGHYHYSSSSPGVLSNGSIPGYTEYGSGLRAAVELPSQWLFLLHDKWWLRERSEIKLEDPVLPPKPIVRIPAAMSRAA